jgi:hypothetical protein
MSPFYRRLVTFGQLVQQLSRINQTNYKDYFEIEHPGFPVYENKSLIKPRLSFKKPCPKKDRHQITDLFNKCFNTHHDLTM